MALRRIWIPSPCYHAGSSKRIIVLHTAEGARTYEDLGHYFQNYNNQVSSHVGIDDKRGSIGEYVSRGYSAWTQANYNGVAVSAELCGFAAWTTAEWKNNHHNMLANCADWIREESQHTGIPITRLNASQAQGSGRGVCQHIDLGAGGGGHVDCGSGFPMDYVLDMARGGSGAPPAEKKPASEELTMHLEFGGQSNRAGIPVPYGATAFRVACSETATLKVIWPGVDGTATINLNQSRSDQNVPKGQTGLTVITRTDSGTAPVYFTWIVPA